jgi:hypothetical protein
MSPHAGFVLLDQIAPRLRKIIPHAVRPVGAEDAEELTQDSIAVAARMLHGLELRGKEVTAGNVCHYVTLLMKSGRRSHGAGRTDAMAAATQLDGKSAVRSLSEPVAIDPETGDEIPPGDLLACDGDDPAHCASRSLDWEVFLDRHDPRYRPMVRDLASGRTCKETAASFGRSSSWAHQLKRDLASDLLEFLGADAIEDVLHVPAWRANVVAEHERATCRAERRTGRRVS